MAVTVEAPAGRITGVSHDDVTHFHSIPYSHIPGEYFDAEPAAEGQDIDATVPRPDAVALSITVPAGTTAADELPVVVYIHGGRYEKGSHTDPRAEGSANARGGVITVQIGYRVLLAGLARFHDDDPAHYRAVHDCQLALDWIQRNIAFFGGDAGNVTVVGQSAGATTALWLCRKDHYRDTFHRVLAMSPCFPRVPYKKRKGLLRQCVNTPLTRKHLSRANPARITRGYGVFRRLIWSDMALGPQPLEPKKMARVPIVVTSARDEFYDLGEPADKRGSGAFAARMLAPIMGVKGNFRQWLEAAKEIDPNRLAGRLIGDSCNRRWVSEVAERAPGPVWMAEFVGSAEEPARHSREIRPLFGVHDSPLNDWLISYAHTGEPGWEPYKKSQLARRFSLIDGSFDDVVDPLGYVREAFNPTRRR